MLLVILLFAGLIVCLLAGVAIGKSTGVSALVPMVAGLVVLALHVALRTIAVNPVLLDATVYGGLGILDLACGMAIGAKERAIRHPSTAVTPTKSV